MMPMMPTMPPLPAMQTLQLLPMMHHHSISMGFKPRGRLSTNGDWMMHCVNV
jgi:hypothetical protein